MKNGRKLQGGTAKIGYWNGTRSSVFTTISNAIGHCGCVVLYVAGGAGTISARGTGPMDTRLGILEEQRRGELAHVGGANRNWSCSRREALFGMGLSLGAIAFTSLLRAEEARNTKPHPLAARPGHFPAKATRCIFLMMEGGPSHIDTFDPKPKLDQLHMASFVRSGEENSAMSSGTRYYVRSPFRFRKVGQSGADMAENWQHLARVADEICFFRGCQVDSINHPTAMYQMNCGNRFGGDPAIGAWVTYGLGTLNENLLGFVVMPEVAYPQGGAANWGNGFLPAHYQATALRPQGSPILDLRPPEGVSRRQQQMELELLWKFNERYAEDYPNQDELQARMESYGWPFACRWKSLRYSIFPTNRLVP